MGSAIVINVYAVDALQTAPEQVSLVCVCKLFILAFLSLGIFLVFTFRLLLFFFTFQ